MLSVVVVTPYFSLTDLSLSSRIGVLIGVAGILSAIPPLGELASVFGLLT